MEEARLEKELIGTNLGPIRSRSIKRKNRQIADSQSSTPGVPAQKGLVRPALPWNVQGRAWRTR